MGEAVDQHPRRHLATEHIMSVPFKKDGNWIGGVAWLLFCIALRHSFLRAFGSVRVVGMCLVVCRDRLLWDAGVGADLEAGVQRPGPDFRCAGLPL